ncbi:MAG: gliding motility-associated peptidyl-prolyl isomerase GldI [Flavobacteriaceae bacterium]
MRYPIYIILAILLVGCGGPEPRKPVKVKTGSFIKVSVERNKELLVEEENLIRKIITADSVNQYLSTEFGAWYYYHHRIPAEGYTAAEEDQVILTYDLLSLNNDTIYSAEEIGTITYYVDREELFPGLRMGVKLLKEGEKATFLYPSHLVFGYHGDNDRIGPNIPVKSTVAIIKIKKIKDSIQN